MTMVFLLVGASAAFGVYSIMGGGTSSSSSAANTDDYGSAGGNLAKGDAVTLSQLQKILKDVPQGYNLLPYAAQILDASKDFNINPLLTLAIALHDSGMGTAGAGKTCRNPGNMGKRSDNYVKSGITGLGNCETVYGGSSRWEAFRTYGDGMQGLTWLLRANYLDKGLTTLPEIIHKYAPSSDGNNETAYVQAIKDFMNKYANF